MTEPLQRPPRLAQSLVALSSPRHERLEILGDLHERFTHRVARNGRRAAVRWYWQQAADAVVRLSISRIAPVGSAVARSPVGGRHMIIWLHRDLRFAFRNLRRAPLFTLAATLTLALGVGANTAIFSVVHGVILRPLPYADPDALVTVWATWRDAQGSRGGMSLPDVRDIQSDARSFSSLASYSAATLTLTGMGEAEVVEAARVTDGLLTVFGALPVLGRDIRTDESHPNGPRVAVIGHAFWQERYTSDPNVLGRTIQLNSETFEIIGVAPPGFTYPNDVHVWIPENVNTDQCGRGCHFLRIVGRMAPGASLTAVQDELNVIGTRLEEAYPANNHQKGFLVESLAHTVYGEVRAGLFILLGAVSLVLLIACANVANLMLVRGSSRGGEIAVRTALGASRVGLVRQLLVEAFVLATGGGVLGILLALAGVRLLLNLAPSNIPRLDNVSVDTPVLLFAMGSIVLITFVFGLVPALRLSKIPVAQALHESGRGSASGRGQWFRTTLLVCEVAMSLVLLSGAGLLLRSFAHLRAVDLGFAADRSLTFTLWLPDASYGDPGDAVQFFERLEERIRSIPSVDAVGSVFGAPLDGNNVSTGIEFLDRPPVPDGQEPSVGVHLVTASYLETIRVPLLQGRMIAPTDRIDTERVGLVSHRLVERFYPDGDVLGKQIKLSVSFGYPVSETPITIVGVVADVRGRAVTRAPLAEIYLAQAQMGSTYLTVVARTVGTPVDLVPAIREEVRALDPNLPLRRVETLSEAVDRQFGSARFHLTLLSVFAAIALALAAIGLYGVVAYLIAQRRREIGVRMALGARQSQIISMVLTQASRPVVTGMVLGVGATLAAGRVMNAILYEVPANDPFTLTAVTAILAAVVLAAILLPARRASRIAPNLALRGD